MVLRRFFLMSCSSIAIVLFLEGIVILNYMPGKNGGNNSYKQEQIGQSRQIGQSIDEPEQEEKKPLEKRPVNLIVLGLDKEGTRTDAIELLNFNPESGQLNMLSIARDTKVRFNSRNTKINSLIGKMGEAGIIEKVEELTGLKIDYYITLDFDGFKKIVDTLGGVEINVPFNMNYDDDEQDLHIHLNKGKQVLDGEKSEQFIRYRKGNDKTEGYKFGDLDRSKAQQEFIKAFIGQKMKLRYLPKAGEIFLILKDCMKTNIEIGDVYYYYDQLAQFDFDNINTFSLPGESRYTNNIWYYIYDKEKTLEMIDKNFFK
ncbi:LytR family transcriptional attenuator [Anaerobacterium chartisolvens]|uniref:LytR family transcriptional attenuator n=2 Tax=Anaerobacterium chartisolvens TaxID=1297424 RepID=A0A369BFL7_9FIRM|nr:LytR family transcriptional attenuator [Anaerobacterium chartisolvens]